MKALTGTASLIRLILRRDRSRLAVWILVLALVPIGTASAFAGLYPDQAIREQLAATVGSTPALLAILGPVYGSSIGALTAWRIGTIGAVLVGLMALLTVIRHTREEEEAGRRELLGSTVVGRHAPLAAAMTVAAATGLVLGLLLVLGFTSQGLPAQGALAYGTGVMLVAVAFAAAGALTAQLTENATTARGLAVGLLGAAFLLRVGGDAGEAGGLGWMSWLSPVGWFSRMRPFAGERWWVLGLWLGVALVLSVAAFAISSRRDVGAGAFPPRPGPAAASPGLGTPLGLVWRLQRGSLVGWTFGLAAAGAVYGAAGDSIGDMMEGNPQLAAIFEALGGTQALTDTFFSAAVSVLALIATAYGIRAVLRLRVEEESLRAESVLATAVTRSGWALSHFLFGVLGPLFMLAVAAAVAGTVYGVVVGDVAGQAPRILGSALVQMPAVWVVTAAALTLFGLVPRLVSLSWGILVGCLLLGQLGQILRFPQWSLNLSPFTHIPLLPAEELEALPLLVLGAVASALAAMGVAGFRRRDIIAG